MSDRVELAAADWATTDEPDRLRRLALLLFAPNAAGDGADPADQHAAFEQPRVPVRVERSNQRGRVGSRGSTA